MSRHSDSNSIEEQVEKLDISTINAERRAYLMHFLNNYREDNKRSPHPRVDLENPDGSSSRIPHVSGPSSVSSSHSNDSAGKTDKIAFRFFRKRKTHNGGITSNELENFGTGRSSSSGKSDSSTSIDDQLIEEEISNEDIKKITVTKLPQLFLVKYLGNTPCTGVKGLNVIRNPIDRLIDAVGRLKMGDDLPLVNVVISGTGIRADPHYLNKGIKIEAMNFPIESISYGVQDTKFCRVYAFIVIQEASSSRVKKAECHAFVCSSPVAARKMSLSLGLSYQSLTRRLIGQEVYSVDLRTPEDLSRIRSSTFTCEADA